MTFTCAKCGIQIQPNESQLIPAWALASLANGDGFYCSNCREDKSKLNPIWIPASYELAWAQSIYLPFQNRKFKGRSVTRKRRRHWKRQIIKNHSTIFRRMNPAWLDAKYELKLPSQSIIFPN